MRDSLQALNNLWTHFQKGALEFFKAMSNRSFAATAQVVATLCYRHLCIVAVECDTKLHWRATSCKYPCILEIRVQCCIDWDVKIDENGFLITIVVELQNEEQKGSKNFQGSIIVHEMTTIRLPPRCRRRYYDRSSSFNCWFSSCINGRTLD